MFESRTNLFVLLVASSYLASGVYSCLPYFNSNKFKEVKKEFEELGKVNDICKNEILKVKASGIPCDKINAAHERCAQECLEQCKDKEGDISVVCSSNELLKGDENKNKPESVELVCKCTRKASCGAERKIRFDEVEKDFRDKCKGQTAADLP